MEVAQSWPTAPAGEECPLESRMPVVTFTSKLRHFVAQFSRVNILPLKPETTEKKISQVYSRLNKNPTKKNKELDWPAGSEC